MRVALALFICGLLTVGCADPSRFSTGPDESYCGTVTGATFVRAGVSEGTRMRFELRAEAMQSAPGRIWTEPFLSGEAFTGGELRVVPELLHDPLSTLSFGEGRVKNGIYVIDLAGSDAGPPSQVLVVLSLLDSGEIEVRLLRGASPGSSAGVPTPTQIFGVWRLKRQKGDCDLK